MISVRSPHSKIVAVKEWTVCYLGHSVISGFLTRSWIPTHFKSSIHSTVRSSRSRASGHGHEQLCDIRTDSTALFPASFPQCGHKGTKAAPTDLALWEMGPATVFNSRYKNADPPLQALTLNTYDCCSLLSYSSHCAIRTDMLRTAEINRDASGESI